MTFVKDNWLFLTMLIVSLAMTLISLLTQSLWPGIIGALVSFVIGIYSLWNSHSLAQKVARHSSLIHKTDESVKMVRDTDGTVKDFTIDCGEF